MAKKYINYTTPRGVLGFTCVTVPSTKFDADGKYSIELIMEKEVAAELIASLKTKAEAAKAQLIQEAMEQASKDPKAKIKAKKIQECSLIFGISKHRDEDGEETGKVVFKASAKAKFTSKKPGKDGQPVIYEKSIGLFDSAGKPLPKTIKIARGSEAKVSFTISPCWVASAEKVGISIRLEAVKIYKLIEWSAGGDAKGFGFDDEHSDGDFTYEAEAQTDALNDAANKAAEEAGVNGDPDAAADAF